MPGTCARASRLIRDYEAEAVAVQAEFSCNEILSLCSLRDAVAVGISLDQVSRGNQLLQMIVQFAALVAVQPKFADELLVASRLLGLL